MITYVYDGNLFSSPAQTLVNTVNTVGIMGKGIALQFKRLYPAMFSEYRRLCESGEFQIGNLYLYKTPNKWILNFPTKEHWREPSRPEYIEKGLGAFVRSYQDMGVHSIAFPALGCGNGRLDFKQVRPLMERYLRRLPVEVFIYPPQDAPYVAEHEAPVEMEKWLRAYPQSLPYAEVSSDLNRLLAGERIVHTLARETKFVARMLATGDIEIVLASGRKEHIRQQELQDFWVRLRDFGFLERRTSGVTSSATSYVMAIFALLPYVSVVRLSPEFGTEAKGLQVLPEALPLQSQIEQLALL